jgi:hypothetical protein
MCFNLAWWENVFIWLVIVAAIVAIIRLFIPFVTSALGAPGAIIGQALNIILWAIIAIVVIAIIFGLLSCLIGAAGGLHLPRPG